MSTLNDVQNAMVDVIEPAIYPDGSDEPSILLSRVTSVTVTNGGADYATATITFTGGGGTGAEAEAVINEDGGISEILMTSFGGGYTSAPTVEIEGDGTGAEATATITAVKVYIFPGDPLKLDLDAILKNQDSVIAVFAVKGMTRNTTRLRRQYADFVVQTATIITTVNNNTVTLTGTVTAGESVMIIVNGTGYAYRALANDTLNIIAAALADEIPGASAVDNVITINNSYDIVARVSVPGTARRILFSQEGIMRAHVISASNEDREILGAAIEIAFGVNGYYMPMPDLVSASIHPSGINEINTHELDLAFEREYLYKVEYHTVEVKEFQTIADAYANTTVSQIPIP